MYKIVDFAKVLMNDFLTSLDKDNITCVDATLGNGNDTLTMCSLIKDKGTVYGYDIQELSLENSKKLFQEHNITNAVLKLQSHEFIEETDIDLVIFNLGFLPGSDKTIKTNGKTTLNALKNVLSKMNQEKMLIIICLYVGHMEGLEESIIIDEFVKNLPSNKYLISKYLNYNRPTSPYLLTISYTKTK